MEICPKDEESKQATISPTNNGRVRELVWKYLGNASVVEVFKTKRDDAFKLETATGEILTIKGFSEVISVKFNKK